MQGGNAQNKKRFIIVSLILILSLALPCFATVTESSGDGFALYNGFKLPNIDSVISPLLDDYPFILIEYRKSSTYDFYGLYAFSDSLYGSYSVGSNTFYTFGRDGSTYSPARVFRYGTYSGVTYDSWTDTGYTQTSIDVSSSANSVIWSNFDLYRWPGESGGVIYSSVSDPIPLDGYHVIEWDGIGSAVDGPDDGSIVAVAPYADPVSAVGVFGSSRDVFNTRMNADQEPGVTWVYGNGTLPYVLGLDDPDLGNKIAFVRISSSLYTQLFAYRESETEGPTGAVTGLNIITPPLGETDFIVYAGTQLQCTAQVTGTGDFNPAVTWSLSYSPSAEYYPTISETGLLSVLPGVPEQRIFITATSVADPSIYATVPVYIMPPAVSSVTITPSSATAVPGQNVQFSATVSGSNVEDSAVTWAVGGASSASTRITRDGLLLIGSDEVSPVIAVRATSDQDGSVYATALVTINVPAAVTGVTITPDDIVLNRGDIQQFTATVSGTGSYDNSVTWQITSVYSAGTSISNTGLLTIGEEQKYDYIIIKATSTADPSLSASAYVFVEDAVSDPMNIDLSVLERLLEEIKNYLKTLQHIFDRPHYFREFNMYTGKLNEQDEQITGLTFNFYRFMQNMEEYVGSIAYTFANGAEVQIREDTTEGFDWFSLFFGKDSGSKVEKSDFAGISTIVTNTRDLFDTGFGFSDFFELIGSVPFFTDEVGSQLDTTVSYFDVRDPDPFNMSVLGNRDEQLEEWRNKHTD